MGIKEDRDALVQAAAGWEGIATELVGARLDIMRGRGRGSEFGLLATSAGIGDAHDTFIDSVFDALLTGQQTMFDIAAALRATARDFGATDQDVADTFHNPDGTPR
jgi:hypothetical protein